MGKDNYCEICHIPYSSELQGCPMCMSKGWTEQFFECKSLGPEPPINKEGYWQKPKFDEIEIEHTD